LKIRERFKHTLKTHLLWMKRADVKSSHFVNKSSLNFNAKTR